MNEWNGLHCPENDMAKIKPENQRFSPLGFEKKNHRNQKPP